MATKKSSKTHATSKTTNSNAQPDSAALTIKKLRRDNKALRSTIDNIWDVLVDVDDSSSRDEALNAVDTACYTINTNFPADYHYINDESKPVQDQAAMYKSAVETAHKRMAQLMNISMAEYNKIQDPNALLPVARQLIAEDYGLEKVPDGSMSTEEYQSTVAYYFVMTVLFSAKLPFDLRKEMRRYIAELNEIKKAFPKGTRKPGEDVQIAMRMLAEGYASPAIYPEAIKDFSKMNPVERTKAKRRLRSKMRAIKAVRAKRASEKKGGNTVS